MAARYGAAAAAQPVAGYAAVAGYGRDYADPYLGHGIGPMAGYGVRKFDLVLCAILNVMFFLGGCISKWLQSIYTILNISAAPYANLAYQITIIIHHNIIILLR